MLRVFVWIALLFTGCAGSSPPAEPPGDPLAAAGVLPRAAWGAAEADSAVVAAQPNGRVRHVVVHHTATAPRGPSPDDVHAHLRAIQRDHMGREPRGWGDIAYHVLISADGTAYAARDPGSAAQSGTVYAAPAAWRAAGQDSLGRTLAPTLGERPGASAGALTVAVIGDYSNTLPPAAQREALVRVVAAALRTHGLGVDDVVVHREVAPGTDCPGQAFYDWLRGPDRRIGSRGPGLDAVAEQMARRP